MADNDHKIRIEIDSDRIGRHVERAVEKVERAAHRVADRLSDVKGVTITVGEEPTPPLSRRERRRLTRDELAAIPVPPETRAEHFRRILRAVINPGSLFAFGGIVIGAISGHEPGLIVLAVMVYLGIASAVYTNLGQERERRLQRLIAAGQTLPGSVARTPVAAPSVASQTTDLPPIPPGTFDPVAQQNRLMALLERIKGRLDPKHPVVDPKELEGYAKVATEYLTRYREVSAYLTGNSAAAAQTEVINLRTQLESLGPDDPRRDALAKLLPIKERTARNLADLERFLLTVEAKLAEEIAQLESLDSGLMRHSLGSFQQQQRAEETVWDEELSSLAAGLESTAQEMQSDLRKVSQQFA